NAIAAAAVSDGAALGAYLTCVPAGVGDAACHKLFIRNLGHVAWRRPLESDEVDRVAAIAGDAAAAYGEFEPGLPYAISPLLQSPNCLDVVEVGQPAPGVHGMRLLSPVELGTRISLTLLDRTPDLATLSAFENGNVSTAEDIKTVARQMLLRPEARTALKAF